MEFLKELIQIQHTEILRTVADTMLSDEVDKQEYINKFNKPNYQLVKVSNSTMTVRKRVKIDDLISSL
jgi:hypothetical protein